MTTSLRVPLRVADCCEQTAGESDKMRIYHVFKTDQWRSAPQIRPAQHFVVYPVWSVAGLMSCMCVEAFNMDETIAVSGELTNVNNYRVVLEEILKMKDNLRRLDIPLNSHLLSPAQQVSSDDTMIHRENNSI